MLQSLAGSSCVRLVEQHRSAWCFALLVLGYLLYLVFGAVVFSSVELPYEDLLRQELGKLKQRFLEEHACLSEPQLEQFLMRVLEASNYGVSVLSNASGNWNWDFTSSLFFASTVLSTTGKGTAVFPAPEAFRGGPDPSGPPRRRGGGRLLWVRLTPQRGGSRAGRLSLPPPHAQGVRGWCEAGDHLSRSSSAALGGSGAAVVGLRSKSLLPKLSWVRGRLCDRRLTCILNPLYLALRARLPAPPQLENFEALGHTARCSSLFLNF